MKIRHLLACTALSAATPLESGAETLLPLAARENLLAWCVVPYDSKHRGPAERIAMLKRLGLSQYVWDWRQEHLKDLSEEIRLSKEAGLRMRGVWLWIDETQDQPGKLGANNEAVFKAIEDSGTVMEFWLGFHDNFFAGLDDEARVKKGVAMVSHLRDRAKRNGGSVALYNHGGWFGEPENQLRVIAAAGGDGLGIVYNFHHGHHQISRFPEILTAMLPHLRAVNINGMKPDGPKILTIGSGTHEKEMLRQLEKSGYRGPLGILCHVEDADAEEILRANLDGLKNISGD
jgi:sugar phosphate isomerase/epimerase